jgi:hypothetical protein
MTKTFTKVGHRGHTITAEVVYRNGVIQSIWEDDPSPNSGNSGYLYRREWAHCWPSWYDAEITKYLSTFVEYQ